MGKTGRDRVRAEVAAERAEWDGLEAESKTGASTRLNEEAARRTAEAHRKIDELARTKTKRPGDRGIK